MAQAAAVSRNRELSLLILGLIVGGGALALVALARDDADVAIAAPFVTVFAGVYLAAHFAVRRFAPRANPLILPLAGIVNGLGIAAIFRLSEYKPYEDAASAQLTWTIVGIGCFIGTLVLVRDARVLTRFKYIFGFAGVGLMLLPLAPGVGKEINGAQLWV
ncbi:MAG: FtsW/RodA/SpoVE family cell cycle protein, partial [Actinomycetota bacterium]